MWPHPVEMSTSRLSRALYAKNSSQPCDQKSIGNESQTTAPPGVHVGAILLPAIRPPRGSRRNGSRCALCRPLRERLDHLVLRPLDMDAVRDLWNRAGPVIEV